MVFKFLTIFISLLSLLFGIHLNIAIPTILENKISVVEKETIATLEIPAISLKQELYDKSDPRNDLNERLIFLEVSSTPDKEKGNVIIAGHSGYGEVSYFKNLYKLKLGDNIILTYHNKNYLYQIVDMYKVPKTGQIEVIRDSNKKTITLITCIGTKDQLVVIGEQKK